MKLYPDSLKGKSNCAQYEHLFMHQLSTKLYQEVFLALKMNHIFLFFVHPFLLFHFLKVTGLSCRRERSKHGFALFYTIYSSSFKDFYPGCVSLCVNDPNCMSLNYWLNSKKCELNTHSRETCPACFTQASAIYMGMARYPGKAED